MGDLMSVTMHTRGDMYRKKLFWWIVSNYELETELGNDRISLIFDLHMLQNHPERQNINF